MIGLTKIDWNQPLSQRENFLLGQNFINGNRGVLLQTCNRVEWYYGRGEISEHIARHLFRVVSGLESSLVGESAIVNQVRTAYYNAAQKSQLDKSLHKLFQTAFYVGKRVRKETGISKGAMSHSQAAVHFLFKEIGEIKNLKITVIGVNSLNENIIKFLLKKDVEPFFIGNRTFDKAKELADKFGAKAFRFDQLSETLEKTDVLISATSAPHFILKKGKFNSSNPIYMLDLAVPRDIDPEIGKLPNVKLYDIGIIENQIKKNLKIRKEKVELANEIIEDEVKLFCEKIVYETK